jgi:chemotaxis family two-component system response regulator PixG
MPANPTGTEGISTKVLIVEDSAELCELIREVLIAEGIEARGITDSTEAAACLRGEKFEAVFLDVHMPPPDGIELARQMRDSGANQNTPIVIITGEKDSGLMARAFQAGANLFLFKPVDRMKLLRILRIIQDPMDRARQQSHGGNVRS